MPDKIILAGYVGKFFIEVYTLQGIYETTCLCLNDEI